MNYFLRPEFWKCSLSPFSYFGASLLLGTKTWRGWLCLLSETFPRFTVKERGGKSLPQTRFQPNGTCTHLLWSKSEHVLSLMAPLVVEKEKKVDGEKIEERIKISSRKKQRRLKINRKRRSLASSKVQGHGRESRRGSVKRQDSPDVPSGVVKLSEIPDQMEFWETGRDNIFPDEEGRWVYLYRSKWVRRPRRPL